MIKIDFAPKNDSGDIASAKIMLKLSTKCWYSQNEAGSLILDKAREHLVGRLIIND